MGLVRLGAVLGIVVMATACGSSSKPSSTAGTSAGSPTTAAAAPTAASSAPTSSGSSTNPTCALLTTSDIDAAATHTTGVSLGAQASETMTLAQGDCIWHSGDDKNFVEVMTTKGTQSLPSGVTEAFAGVGTGSYFVTPQSPRSALNTQCFQVRCEFTAVTNAKGYLVQVGALFTPPPADPPAAGKALLTAILARLPG